MNEQRFETGGESFIEKMVKAVEDFNRRQEEREEKLLAEICKDNFFVVSNEEIKKKFEEFLPEDAQIKVMPYAEDCIYVVKKSVLDFPFEDKTLRPYPFEVKE